MIRVVIADDQELVRSGFVYIVGSQTDMEVVGEAGDGLGAIERARRLTPDVVVMDIRMPRLDGIEATRRIVRANPATRVLVLTTFDLDEHLYEAMTAGASAFLLKDAPPEQLVSGIRMVAAGEALVAPAITRRLIAAFVDRSRPSGSSALERLTEREHDVLRSLAGGRSNQEIAAELHLSEATVKTHVSRIYAKLDVRDRAQAVVVAYEEGLVEPGHTDGPLPPGDA
ncbi:MAG: response regulator transcription factor [Egibacteraceae bacterium]